MQLKMKMKVHKFKFQSKSRHAIPNFQFVLKSESYVSNIQTNFSLYRTETLELKSKQTSFNYLLFKTFVKFNNVDKKLLSTEPHFIS